ncbi:hypothetical protein BGZ61DRAFT_465209 [Ilyonectria robusta]|uniref:uncharacterized protein n=1 Tax=Ilyonectria robusta TaxID=1079257 RepID=UPI001E8D8B66|nr:uncharacterized protein BGZ61DRAFT_465209 [Ilyonectria robusta]KAH8659608.1 hypothetical protein BGZ61DRAFT_465209 [Ilyonectria robusta]
MSSVIAHRVKDAVRSASVVECRPVPHSTPPYPTRFCWPCVVTYPPIFVLLPRGDNQDYCWWRLIQGTTRWLR